MTAPKSRIGYPWILDAIAKYNGGPFSPKAAPAQVVEFLKMPEHSKECQSPAAIVYISDRRYYIRAIITREAQETLEREDEHFTVADIKNKIIILKKFTLSFAAEEDLGCCEFFLTIQHFSVLPMETDRVDILNCNMEPGVRKRIKELWQNYKTELALKETFSDLNSSDVSLTQLLIIASEEKLTSLKSIAEQCLDLDQYATQEISAQARTTWSVEMRNNKDHSVSFSVPINLLIIPPEQEAALEQMSEIRPNDNSNCDDDDVSVEENASTQYSTAASTFSQESMEDACNSLSGNPWNNLQSICLTGSTGSAVLDSNNTVPQQSCEGNIAVDSDSTPDIYKDHQDSNETQDHSPSLLPPGLPSNVTILEEMSNSTHVTEASDGTSGLPSIQRKCAGSSSHTQDGMKDYQASLSFCSPQKTVTLGSKVQISPIMFHSSEADSDLRLDGNIFSSDSAVSKNSTSRVRQAVKRKQTPKDPDTTLSDLDESVLLCMEKPNCTADFPMFKRTTSLSSKSNEMPPNKIRQVDILAKSCVEKEPERKEVGTGTATETLKAAGMSPARKKAPPYKPSLDFVAQPKVKVTNDSESLVPTDCINASSTPCKMSSPGALCKQTSDFQAPVREPKKGKMTHFDGTPFQYKYKTPSAELRARVKALKMPTELCKWAKIRISDAKEKVP